MKILNLSIIIALALLTACKGDKSTDSTAVAADTITTESGLKYYYITKGEGRPIERGCEVGAYLELLVEDSVVWTSANAADSLFMFRAGVSGLIPGFTEMSLLLREGDEVVTIMPPELAYGESGTEGFVPPNSVIKYSPFRIVKVGEPKLPLSEFLKETYDNEGFDAMVEFYNNATTTADSVKYMTGLVEVFRFWEMLTSENKHEEAAKVSAYFGSVKNEIRLRYSTVLSLESLGQFQAAKDSLLVLQTEMPGAPIIEQKLRELDAKMATVQP